MGFVDDSNDFQEIEHPVEEPAGRPRSSRRRERYKPSGTAFIWRMMAAFLGAALLLLVVGFAYGDEMRAVMSNMTADVEGRAWAQYAGMGGILFAVILACSIVAGVMDSSAIRAIFLGAGLCAVVAVGAVLYQSKNLPAVADMAPAVRMGLAALNPAFNQQLHAFDEAQQQAAETQEKLEEELKAEKQKVTDADKTAGEASKELSDLKESLSAKLEAAKEEGAQAKAAEMQAALDEKDQGLAAKQQELDASQKELEAAQKELADLKKDIDEVEAAKKEMEAARTAHVEEMSAALKKLEDAQNRVKELEEVNKKLEEELDAAKKRAARTRRR